jgi:hypothetical protein
MQKMIKGKGDIVLPLHAMKAYVVSEGMAPLILNLGTRWRWVVSLTPQLLYLRGKSPWQPEPVCVQDNSYIYCKVSVSNVNDGALGQTLLLLL